LAVVGQHGKLGSMSEPDPGGSVAAPEDPACAAAHGHAEVPAGDTAHGHAAASADDIAHGYAGAPVTERTLIAIFASPVARFMLRYAQDAGFRPVLVEPDAERALAGEDGFAALRSLDGLADRDTDVVVTDHHRPELGAVLRDALASPARWVGVMGNPKHPAPHIPALAALGVPDGEIARVHRPIGLNIGSRAPAEIALATVAGLIADRNGRPGGFEF
jgi:xanthine/CO dehydrogenase XdhC/CoxF family maturation factor